jgi:hypothetical protein
MIVNFPAYSHWSRTPAHYIKERLIKLGCTIVKEDGTAIQAEVPDEWYFVQKGSHCLKIYSDRNYTEKIAEIKENMNTGKMLTLFEN